MKRLSFVFVGMLLVAAVSDGKVCAAQSDSAYTGATNSAAATEPVHKKKKKAKEKPAAQQTNSPAVSEPATPKTNAPAAPEPDKPRTNAATESEPISPMTNSIVKPSAPAATTTAATEIAPAINSDVKPSAPAASTNATPVTTADTTEPRVATLSTTDLKEYGSQPPRIQSLITHGLELTSMNLKYQYGSADPTKGGMDCSGTVYYLLKQAGIKDVPRDASELYSWVWKKEHVVPVTSSNLDTFELTRLQPGDLLFWSGTYDIQRDPPVTHVMIYLGTNKQTGQRVMLGASEGRTYAGKPRYGVSVFDFVLPKSSSKSDSSRFIGYGPIPDL